MSVNKLENSTYFTYGSLETHSAQPENSFQSEEFEMQKIIPYKALQMYRNSTTLRGKKVFFICVPCFHLFGRTYIYHVRQAVNLNDFFPSLNKPVFEFTHELVLCTSSRGRDVNYGSLGVTSSSDGKESACNAGDPGWIPGLGRSPGGGHGNPLQYSCLENPHGKKSLGYSPWGHKESDTTE